MLCNFVIMDTLHIAGYTLLINFIWLYMLKRSESFTTLLVNDPFASIQSRRCVCFRSTHTWCMSISDFLLSKQFAVIVSLALCTDGKGYLHVVCDMLIHRHLALSANHLQGQFPQWHNVWLPYALWRSQKAQLDIDITHFDFVYAQEA